MSLFEANLAVLRLRHPEAARRLEGLAGQADQGYWSPTRSGAVTVRRQGALLASSFDPAAEAARAVPDWAEADFAVLPGIGAGYLAEAVAARYPDLPVVVAEEDPVWLAEVLNHRDVTGLLSHPPVVLLLGPDPGVLGQFLMPLACRTVEVLFWRPLERVCGPWRNRLAEQVVQAQAQARVNLATYRRFAPLWRRNLAKNEAQGSRLRPLSALAGWASGLPAVIAAAGPSLAERFSWMRQQRQRFLLIAVDTSWPALSAQGLEPDVLVILDGQYWNARHVDKPLPSRTLVVTEWIGPPRAFRLAPGKTYVAASSVPFLRARESALWGELGSLPSGGSVATAAWSLALLLGCREVAFAGLDLGYPRGLTHVPGSQFEEAIHRKARRLNPAETQGLGLRGNEGTTRQPALDGGELASDVRMDLFRRWISAAVAARPEVKAVNLGTRGSVIPGLLPAEPDYGSSWAEVRLGPPPAEPVLRRGGTGPTKGPFPALARVLGEEDFAAAVEEAWAAARAHWGPAWDAWAGRAKATWDRWPSQRSRRAVEEVVSLALDWQAFDKPE